MNSAIEAAIASYEQAVELDPDAEKARVQLIHAQAALSRQDEAIAHHRQRLADRPDDLSAHRLLAYAHITAHDYHAADRLIEAGLAIEPNDARLVELRGAVLAATGDPDGALATWQRALELDPDNISGHYSRAFLLERSGRLEEAAGEWRAILAWSEAHGSPLDAEWPRRELARLQPHTAQLD